MVLGKCTGWPFYDLDPRSVLWHRLAKICCLRDKLKTTRRIITKHSSVIALVVVITWLDFGEVLWETLILANCLKKFWCVFQGQTLFWSYLRNGWSDWCETIRKCISWMLGTICDLDLWPHSWPWPWMFQVKFRNSPISGIVGLNDVKWKRSELIWYWADCMTLPFDHTHDLDLGVEISRSESEIALS